MLGRDVLISYVPKYSMIVAENRGFSSRNYLGLFLADLGLFCHFCQVSGYRARFQASSGHSDSANSRGYEAVLQLLTMLGTN